jgi:hypothetical protein
MGYGLSRIEPNRLFLVFNDCALLFDDALEAGNLGRVVRWWRRATRFRIPGGPLGCRRRGFLTDTENRFYDWEWELGI